MDDILEALDEYSEGLYTELETVARLIPLLACGGPERHWSKVPSRLQDRVRRAVSKVERGSNLTVSLSSGGLSAEEFLASAVVVRRWLDLQQH